MKRRRLWLSVLCAAVLGGAGIASITGSAAPADPCGAGSNPIVCENSKPGQSPTIWQIGGAGDSTLQGFSTDISVNHGQTVRFKINDTNAAGTAVGGAYHVDILRVGYYQGNGARLIDTISAPTATLQPSCLTEANTGLIDCGNWSESASWAVPSTAVSGLYIAHLVRNGVSGDSHIYFVVRDDERHAPVLFQTSDETWNAYNAYGGNSLYVGNGAVGRAYKISYNRPLATANNSARNTPMYHEYPMIRFLEKNGYDMSYFSDIDTARSAAELKNHKVFMSVGHDEYWSAEQRSNVTAARDAGVNLAFFSANEIFWKTRFAASLDTSASPWRTVVCYKESKSSTVPIDPANPPTSTGTWRDPRFASADGAKPENALSGQIYMVDALRDDAISIPAADGKMRFWRDTSIATLAAGTTATLPKGTLGYEWDEELDNGSRPAGLFHLSSTTVTGLTTLVVDNTGTVEGNGTGTHNMSLYRAPGGALVFGAGTTQWSLGLDDQHATAQDSSVPPPDARMQQATVNLLADMGAQPVSLQAGLVQATQSTDTTAPASTISSPAPNAVLNPNQAVTVTGTAADTGGGVIGGVEVSTDGGTTWHAATGRESWTYTYTPTRFGQSTIKSRAIDDSGNIETPGAGVTVSIGSCPCSIFGAAVPSNPATTTDSTAYELGVKFRSEVAGYVSGVRFYKGTTNTGTHIGHLWAGTGGSPLATVTFKNETASGWQQANFDVAVAINANTTYVVSYWAPNGNYAGDRPYFNLSGVDSPPLHALQDGVDGPNGVFSSGVMAFPSSSYQSTNYYVDVLFDTSNVDRTPPTVTSVTPANGATGIATSVSPAVKFSEAMTAASINTTSMELKTGTTAVPASVTYDAATTTATITPSSPLSLSTTYTATVHGGANGVKDLAGNALVADYTWSFTTATPAACPCTIFPASATPTIAANFDSGAYELGVKFRSDQSGYIRSLRFYKGTGNTGTHVGHLWSSTGTLLAQITFTSETAGGWQQVDFPRPVAVSANTTYVASYFAPNGNYALDRPYFNTGVDRSPLHGLADGADGPNGVYAANGGFPTTGTSASNYWVDVIFDTDGTDRTPPLVTSVSPAAGATGIATSRTVSATFNEPIDPLSVQPSSVFLRNPAGTVIPATVAYNANTWSAEIKPNAPLATATTYTAVVLGGASGVKDVAGNALAADYTWSFTTGVPATCPCNLFGSLTPTVAASTDTAPTEVGVKFRSDVDGYVTGLRFYKGVPNTGTHVGHLWTTGGIQMGAATFSGETASGWQTVSFASPIAVRANTTYIASYYAPNGGYALDRPYFGSWVDRPPLHAPADGVEGPNGVFRSGTGFPDQQYGTASATNYWIDVTFDTTLDRTLPTITSTTPASGATGVFRSAKVKVVFSKAIDPTTVTTSTVFLRDSANATVPAAVAYDSATTTATLTPSSPLTAGATYTATVVGGSGGVKDTSGNALAANSTWSFTVSSDVTAPTTTATCNGGGACGNWFGTSPVTVTLAAVDETGGSGVDTIRYTVDGSDPRTSTTAAVYASPFTVTSTTQIRWSAADKAGNVETPGGVQVRIDTTPPSAPTLSFGSFTNASYDGATVWYRAAAAGSFTVTGQSTDAESGVASYRYPSLGTGWSGSGGAYNFAAGAADPVEPNNVTAVNGAGLSSAATSFTVTPDDRSPTTTITCAGGSCAGWFTAGPVSVSLSAADTGSGVDRIVYTTDGSDPTSVRGTTYLGAFTLSATATVKFRAYDKVGNEELIGTQQVRIDTSPPVAPALALSESSPWEYAAAGTLFYNPSGTHTASFSVTATTSDPESGIDRVSFPPVFGTDGSDATASPYSATYTFAAGATASGAKTVTARNGAGLTSTGSFTVTPDTTAPSGGSVSYADGYQTATSVTVTTANGTDNTGGSGLDLTSAALQRDAVALTGGTCGTFTGTWTAASSPDTTAVSGTCYRYRYLVSDNVGNVATYTSASVVKVDTTAPSTPSLGYTVSAGAAVTGNTVFYNPAKSGNFAVTASSTDAESGIAGYAYPNLGTGFSGTNGSYTFAVGAVAPLAPATVTATNGAGLTSSASFTVTSDSAAPASTISCSGGCGGWHTTSPITITLASTDGGSGLDRILYSTDGTAPSLLYTAPFTVASTATVKFAAYDRVGNLEPAQSQLVQVDTTPPAAPTLTLTAGTGSWLRAGVLYFNAAAAGNLTVAASATDAESGIASYGYPSLGTGWSGSNGAYSFAAGAAGPGTKAVTATNNAGLTSAGTNFTVTADSTAPVTTITCTGGCAGWHTTSPVTVTLDATDAGAGLDRILYSTTGGTPATVYSGAFTIASTATLTVGAVDKVGNTEATQTRQIQIDTTPPSAPSLAFSGFTNASQTGSTLFYKPGVAGGFTLTPTSTDAESGIASYAYPSLGTGFTNTTGTYSFTAAAVALTSPASVTATNGAGLTSPASTFNVTPDSAAPTTTVRCGGTACSTGYSTSTVNVTLAADDGVGSGVDRIVYTLDGTDPTAVRGTYYLGGISLSATTTVKFRAYDKLGNEEAIGTQLIRIDTTPPTTPVLTIDASSPLEYAAGTRLYYNSQGTNTASFTVNASSSDAESQIQKLRFPAIAGLTGGGDVTTTPYASTYTWTATTTASGNQTVTAFNNAGLTSSADITLTPDTTAPAGGSVGYADGYTRSGTITITTDPGTDAGAGIGTTTLERHTATLANGTCQAYGAWTAVASPDTVADATCVQYRYRVRDRVGNEQIYASANVVKVDSSIPSAPALTLTASSKFEYVDAGGTKLFYNPSSGNTASFTVDAATSAASGIDRVTFPAIATMTGGGDVTATPYRTTYSWTQTATADGAQTVTARSSAGGTSSSTFTVVRDAAAPTGQTAAIAGGPWFTTTSITVTTNDGSDALAGIDTSSRLLERASAPLSGGTCGTMGAYAGSFSSPDTTVQSGFCYRYRFSIADRVGNRSAPLETAVAMVDTTAPTAPTLAYSGFNHASVTDSTVFYNSTTGGGFTVGATSTDPESGVASYAFPAFGTGWTGGGSGGVYTVAAGAVAPVGPNHVTATNRASLTSTATDFVVTADGAGPTGGSVSYTDGYRNKANPKVDLTLADGTDALSGVNATNEQLQRSEGTLTDGACSAWAAFATLATHPAPSYTDSTVTSGHCYRYRYLVEDKVGNLSTYTSDAVAKVDTDAPTAQLADPGANLRLTVNLSSTQADTGGSGIDTVTYQRSDGAGGWTTIPQAFDTKTAADGLYDLRVVVVDRAGNQTISTPVTGRRIDNTPPSAVLADPGAFLRGVVNLTSQTSDAGSGIATVVYQVQPTGSTNPWLTVPAAWDTSAAATPDGLYDVRVDVKDVAGNETINTVVSRRVDNTPPNATMGSLPSAISGTVSLASATSDNGSGVKTVTYERSPAAANTWTQVPASFDTTTVADADYDFHVVAVDNAGNQTVSAPVSTHVDNTSPRPTSVSPADATGSVATNTTVTATFPRAMDSASVIAGFTLSGPAGNVAATVTFNSTTNKATLTPNAALAESTTYTAKLATSVKDTAGKALYQAYTWTFSTGVMPPTVTAKTPAGGATGVSLSVAPTATFSRAMTDSTINTSTVTLAGPSGAVVAAAVVYSAAAKVVTVTPSVNLAYSTVYTVSLGSGIKSAENVALAPVSWSFTTLAQALPPTVTGQTPAPAATGVGTGADPTATFSRDMKGSSLTGSTFTLTGPSGAVAATVSYDSASKTATLAPNGPLAAATTYTARVDGTVQAADGAALGTAVSWTFTTTNALEVFATNPAANATDVGLSILPTVQMSRALDATTVTTANVKLVRAGGSGVPIAVAYNAGNSTITLTPSVALDYSMQYTIQLTTAIKAADATALSAQFNSSFTVTGAGLPVRLDAGSTTSYTAANGNVFGADASFTGGTARTVANPINPPTDAALYQSERYGLWSYKIPIPNGYYDVKLTFIELTYAASGKRIFSVDVLNTTPVNDISNLDVFAAAGAANKPYSVIVPNVQVSARLLQLRAVANLDDPEIAAIEIIPHPSTVGSASPAPGSTAVPVGTTASAVFENPMDASSLTASTVYLSGPGGALVPAAVAYDATARKVTLTPSAPLASGTSYTAWISAAVRDQWGMTLGAPYSWTFTTG